MKSDIQAELFKIIKTKLIGQDSIGNVLSDILHLSPDAVYRRYRGDTSLTIQETKRICHHFDISFDALAQLGEGKAIFQYPPLNTYDFSLESYLEGIAESFRRIKKLTNPEIILSVSNTHFFQSLNFPQLVRFQLFFWAKTHLQIEAYKEENFKHEKTTNRAFELGKEILQMYNSIPSTEIFDPELMRGFMRQILYYYKSHMFADPEYALFLFDRALLFSKHLKEQAVVGKKFIYGTSAPNTGNDFNMYLNETINSDTTFYYTSKETKGIFVTHNVMNYLHTNSSSYVTDSKQIIDKQLSNSSLISHVNEKERNNFFYDFEKMILSFRKKIEADLYF
jgi:hypothetical protein